MPASPDHGAQLAARILAVIHAAEQAILRLIAARLRAGRGQPDWESQKLAELQLLRARITNVTTALNGQVADEVNRIVLDAYNRGQALAIGDLDHHGLPSIPAMSPIDNAETLARTAVENIVLAIEQVPDLVTQAYRDAVAAGVNEVLSGEVTRLQASQHVLDRLATRGISGFRDRAGRDWSLEAYAEMAVRTGAGRAAIQGHVDALAASGMDLVIVSDSPRECPMCRPWERKVLSIGGRVGRIIEPAGDRPGGVVVDVAGSLAEALAVGLFHCNCTHTVSAYLPGVTKSGNAVAEPARYELGQRQRQIERNIRAWKRREAVALDVAAQRRALAKVREWQAALRQHVSTHDLQRLRHREQVGAPGQPLAH